MTLATKDDALDALEVARADYLSKARLAILEATTVGQIITIDDVRALCPPPDCIDPRVMGGVLRDRKTWEPVGYTNSRRRTCHKRPIGRFKRVG